MDRAKRRKISRKAAVALRYDRPAMPAPQVVAKGRGVVAENLIALARKNGVPVVEDRLLVETLDQLNVDQEIPPELYQVVAEILVAIYKAETGKTKK
ncbi:MAG TPA: EscU/YscU/HrcU family type III secretion system export apparatus switch protein [bacterium]|nr:EscU/YscU/HrcU family type III secretion system export apparatus switch protein [bacterium]